MVGLLVKQLFTWKRFELAFHTWSHDLLLSFCYSERVAQFKRTFRLEQIRALLWMRTLWCCILLLKTILFGTVEVIAHIFTIFLLALWNVFFKRLTVCEKSEFYCSFLLQLCAHVHRRPFGEWSGVSKHWRPPLHEVVILGVWGNVWGLAPQDSGPRSVWTPPVPL